MKRKPSALRISKSILEMTSFIAMAASVILFGITYKSYPAGEQHQSVIFAWMTDSEKVFLLASFFISAGVMSFIFLLYRFPKLYRYPQKITADNIETQYHLAKIMLSLEQILAAAFFSVIYIIIYYTGTGIVSGQLKTVPMIIIAVAAAIIPTYLILAKKYR